MSSSSNLYELLTPASPYKRGAQHILLFSYHFPPGDSTGALRWQKLAAFAAARGWTVDVITRHPDDLKSTDARRLAQLPTEVRVFGVRTPASQPALFPRAAMTVLNAVRKLRGRRSVVNQQAGGAAQPQAMAPAKADLIWRKDMKSSLLPGDLRRAYRAWSFFQSEREWCIAAKAAALQIFDGHTAVISCGPPHMPHLTARAVARRKHVPFIMDMRDPWSMAPALPSEFGSTFWYRMAEKYEAEAVASASLVVTNTSALGQAMRAKYPAATGKVITVMNGCDEEVIPAVPREKFVVCYAGNIYIDRDPSLLFRAFAQFVKREQVSPDQAGIELIGHVDQFGGVPVQAIAQGAGVGEYLTVFPRMPRPEALKAMARAAVLLSLPQEVHLAVPSKLFEYMLFPSWVVALAAPGSATSELLKETTATIVEPDDCEGLATAFSEQWRAFRAGQTPQPINADGRYDRRRQADHLFEALEEVCGSKSAQQIEAA